MGGVIPPERRVCLRCNRTEQWSDHRQTWTARTNHTDAEGTQYCVHEWDITGTYNPFE